MKYNKILSRLLVLSMMFISMTIYADMDKDLRHAAQDGDIEVIKQLLDKGVDVNAAGKKGSATALIKAAKEGHTNVVQLLLFHGADPSLENKKGRSAIDIAERNKYNDIVDIMKEGIKEQIIQFTYRKLEPDEFASLMLGVFNVRVYHIEKVEPYNIIASYGKRGRLYKVRASVNNNRIMLEFLRGYGARKINYLLNLKKDLIQVSQ